MNQLIRVIVMRPGKPPEIKTISGHIDAVHNLLGTTQVERVKTGLGTSMAFCLPQVLEGPESQQPGLTCYFQSLGRFVRGPLVIVSGRSDGDTVHGLAIPECSAIWIFVHDQWQTLSRRPNDPKDVQ